MTLPALGNPTGETDAEFWSRQLQEHAKFLFLMIEDSDLAKRAKSIDLTFEEAQKTLRGKTLEQQANLLALPIFELRKLKVEVRDAQRRGEWVGWAWPSFVEHVLAELDYAWAKLTRQESTAKTELQTWLKFMQDHASFAAQLLDPTEQAKQQHARTLATVLEKASSACLDNNCQAFTLPTLLALSQQRGQELDAYLRNIAGEISSSRLRSMIHPVLAVHVIREGQRFLATTQYLKTQTSR